MVATSCSDAGEESPQLDDVPASPSPSVIVVMGATGSGKTSFINLASKSKLNVGTDLKSCTGETQATDEFTVDDRPVVLIDTPGFHDTFKSDMDILTTIAESLASRHARKESLAGVIYIHRISDVRFTGTAVKSFKTLLAMCGDQALCNVVIVTSMWEKVTREVGDAREQELESDFFKPALDKGAQFLRHEDTTESTHKIIRAILGKERVPLRIQEEIADEGKQIDETIAGKELRRELDEQVKKRREQLQDLQEMLNETEADDGETRRELEQEVSKLREELEAMGREMETMSREPGQPTWTRALREVMQDTMIVGAVTWTALVGLKNFCRGG